MIFVFGGAYQGKLDFVKEKFGLHDDIFTPRTVPLANATSFSGVRCINGLHTWVRELVDNHEDVDARINELIETLSPDQDIVIIMNDVSQGIVPMDPVERAFREANGRAMIKLAREAEEVYRVFCGIGIKIK